MIYIIYDILLLIGKQIRFPFITGNRWMNKLKRKPKGKSTMDNPEKRATLGTLDTGGEQTKQKTQHRKLNRWEIWTPPIT